MAVDLTDFSGAFGLGSFNFSQIVDKIYLFVGIFLLIFIFCAVFAGFYFTIKRKVRKKDLIKIYWWEEIAGSLVPLMIEDVEELIMAGTQLRIFYGKDRDIWLPRFNRPIAPKLYYVERTKTGQIINFEMRKLSEDKTHATLEADHTDMLWAAENAREFIKRNYRDKAKKWWDVYADKIAMAALMFVFTFCFVIIIYFMRGIVTDISGVANSVNQMAQTARASSGVIPG